MLIGAGGLGGQIGPPLVRKGLGHLDILDSDVVELSNLNRQAFFPCDLYKPKAVRLAHNAARQGHSGNRVTGHHVAFTEYSANRFERLPDVAICAVDNNATRAFGSQFFRHRNIPVIFTAVNDLSDYGWVFVQEATGACLACVFPRIAEAAAERQRCQPVPAVVNILSVVGGIVLHAVDRLLMGNVRDWNFHSVHLSGQVPGVIDKVQQKDSCQLCQANMACAFAGVDGS